MILVWYTKEINKYKKGYPRSRGANMAPLLDKRKTDARTKEEYIDAKADRQEKQQAMRSQYATLVRQKENRC